jgi:glycine dehydrogenase subunit 1
LVGPRGLAQAATASHANTTALEKLTRIPGVVRVFDVLFFHEALLKIPAPVGEVLAELEQHGILGGINASDYYAELDDTLLVCATETKTEQDLELFANQLEHSLKWIKLAT